MVFSPNSAPPPGKTTYLSVEIELNQNKINRTTKATTTTTSK